MSSLPPPEMKKHDRLVLNLSFDADQVTLKEADYEKLNGAIDFIKRFKGSSVVIEGHTDNVGSKDYNHNLSHKRAEAVKRYLAVHGGIPEPKMKTITITIAIIILAFGCAHFPSTLQIQEKISEFEKKVEETNKESIKGHASLKEQLQMLKEMNQQVTQEAKNLTTALKGQSKTQGNWGEFILESILEKSGLVKGREYVVQESLTAESGKRFQPDVIINLPENKSIIIDSKVSLVGYERFISAEDEHEKQLGLREHINSIRSHIKNLSGKNYQNLYQLESLDFVLMFMPIEPAFAYAVQSDPSLFSDAFEQNIVIVSPSTLLATLRTISSIWRQESQNKNALEIARQSGEMLDKFAAFVDDLISVGKGLVGAKDNYDKAMNKLSEGRGNLISRSEKIKKLGAKASKSLPPNILNRADIDDENNLLDN